MKRFLGFGLIIILILPACSIKAMNNQAQLEIHDIQGCSHSSPYISEQIDNIEGVVTHKNAIGFTMQSTHPDDLDCSSEAIFVFTKDYPDVMIADTVRVSGVVEEFTDGNAEDYNLSQTEITKSQYKVLKSNTTLPDPIIIDNLAGRIPTSIIEDDAMSKFDPFQDGLDFYESLESMLVQVIHGQVVAPRNEYDEITIIADVFKDRNAFSNQGALLNTREDFNPEKLMVKLQANYKETVEVGDSFDAPIVGIIDYSYGNYKLLLLSSIQFNHIQKLIEPFTAITNDLTLATYNLENLSPMDESKKFHEAAKQIVKVLQSPDVLVLNEIMDNSGSMDDGVVRADQTINRLIEAITKAGGPEYSFSDTPPYNNQDGGIAGGNIRTVLLYRADKDLELEKGSSTMDDIKYKDGRFAINRNPFLMGENTSAFITTRKPRVWLLNQNGSQFFVVGVHLTSQGASNPDWGSQQPPQKPEESRRIEEARLINSQLKEILALNPKTPIFIVGDMNDLPWSGTLMSLSNNDFVSSANKATPEENYSYIFEGNAQELDYILVNQNLASNVLQARFIHVNTFLDQSDAISDHDPLMIEFNLNQ